MVTSQKYSDLLIGRSTDSSSKIPSNKKNIPHAKFISNPKLIKQFGFWADTDKDKVLNFADCFPFDKTRHVDVQQVAQQNAIEYAQKKMRGWSGGMPSYPDESWAAYRKLIRENPDVGRAIDTASQLRQDLQSGNYWSRSFVEQYKQQTLTPEGLKEATAEMKAKGIKPPAVGVEAPKVEIQQGTFDPNKQVFTDVQGNKMSMSQQEFQKLQQQPQVSYQDLPQEFQTPKKSQSLNINPLLNPYGTTSNVLSRISDRNNLLVDSRSRSSFFGNFADIVRGFDKKTEERKEYYDPRNQMFVSASPTGGDATLIQRPATSQELRDIDRLSGFQAKVFGSEKSGNILTTNLYDLKARSVDVGKINKNIKKLNEELDKLEKGNLNEFNQWVGTEEKYSEYRKKYSEYENNLQKLKDYGATVKDGEIKQPTISTGVFGLTKEIPLNIKEIENIKRDDPFSQVAAASTIFRLTAGATAGQAAEKIARKLGVPEEGVFQYTSPEVKGKIQTPVYGTIYQNPLTGQKEYFKEEEFTIPEKERKIITPSQIGKTAEFTGEIAPYFIPYYFWTEQTGKIGSSVMQTDTLAKGGLKYVKDYPVDALIVGGLGVYKGYKSTKGYLTSPIIEKQPLRAKNVLEEPVAVVSRPIVRKIYTDPLTGKNVVDDLLGVKGLSQEAREGSQTLINTRWNRLFGKKLKISKPGEKIRFELLPENPIYSGIPFGKTGQESYKDALERLIKAGYPEKEARKLLRLRRPSVVEKKFKGGALVRQVDEESPIIFLKGTEKSKGIGGFAGDVPFYPSQGRIKFIDTIGQPYKEVGDTSIFRLNQQIRKAFLTDEGRAFSKLSQEGRTTETFDIFSGAKNIGSKELPKEVIFSDEIKSFKTGEYDLFKQVDISKRTIPLKRKPGVSTATVYVEQGNPLFTISDEAIGKSTGFWGGGKSTQSGEQFFQQLYDTSSQITSTLQNIVRNVKKSPPNPKTSTTAKVVETTQTPRVSLYVGTGMYERTEGGVMPLATAKTTPKEIKLTSQPNYLNNKINVSLKTNLEIGNKLDDSLKVLQTTSPSTSPKSESNLMTNLEERQREQIKPLQIQPVSQTTEQIQQPVQTSLTFSFPGETLPVEKTKPRKKPPVPPILPRRKKKFQKAGLFDVFVKRGGSWQKVADDLRYKDALDVGGTVVDKTLAASFKLVPEEKVVKAKKKPKKIGNIDVKDSSWGLIANQFRDYQIKDGKKVKTDLVFIEKAKNRLSNPSEVSRIQVARKRTPPKSRKRQKVFRL